MKTTTVYRGPGYPVDPKKETKRNQELANQFVCIRRGIEPVNRAMNIVLDTLERVLVMSSKPDKTIRKR